MPGFNDVAWFEIGVCHVQRFQPKDPRHLLLVLEARIGILGEPLIVIEDRVIHAVRPAGTDVRGRHAEVLQKWRVI